MDASRIPVIVGVAQLTRRERTEVQLDPLAMMADASRAAWADSRAVGRLAVDTLYVVNCASRRLPDPVQTLAEQLDIQPTDRGYTAIGATAPQWFVNRVADRIAAGESRWALICGGEAYYTRAPIPDLGGSFAEYFDSNASLQRYLGDVRAPVTALELGYGLLLPIHMYCLIENDLRARLGLTPNAHRRQIAEFVARSSLVAAAHPYAHRQRPLSADEVETIGPHNRMVAFPYSKLMCSNIAVNQAAALIATSWAAARAAGVPDDRIVFVRGAGAAEDAFHVTERPRLSCSPSVADAVHQAMRGAGTTLDEIAHLDLYSCFPCAPRIVMDALGIDLADERSMTITGGMPVFGGAGNNYATHAIATMVELLRREPASFGLVHTLSWYLSKHVVGVYSGRPPDGPRTPIAPAPAHPRITPIAVASGPGSVESYVINYDRDGAPDFATVIGRDAELRRFIARVRGDRAVLEHMASEDPIGRRGTVAHVAGSNSFTFSD